MLDVAQYETTHKIFGIVQECPFVVNPVFIAMITILAVVFITFFLHWSFLHFSYSGLFYISLAVVFPTFLLQLSFLHSC